MYSEGLGQNQGPENGGTVTNGQDGSYEDGKDLERSAEDMEEGQFQTPTLRKRMSTTFWRRKSSAGLNGDGGYFPPQGMNGIRTENGTATPGATNDVATEVHSIEPPHVEDMRPRSPPPVIPELEALKENGYLGSEDMFNHIG